MKKLDEQTKLKLLLYFITGIIALWAIALGISIIEIIKNI